MSRRTIALILAVALAALATIALISYINGLEDDALAGTQPVEVFVAKEDIPPGVSGDTASQQGLIERVQVPAKVAPEGAITSLQEVSGKVAAVAIFKDEIIVGQRFVAPGAAVKGVLPIPQGKHAVSVQVGLPPGVAGFIQPGDKITLVIGYNQRVVDRLGKQVDARLDGPQVKFLLQNIDVLAVGSRIVTAGLAPATATEGNAADQGGCCLLTVALSPVDVEKLVWAIHNAQLYFSIPAEKSPSVRTPGRNLTNLFN